ncbi:MAG: hypothetical protein RMI43_05430 [Candidatus Caldarchaeum sp.]|nr:hypothetical protein [Candidatus Caldarchaeum sp.]MCX8200827.1 hypothetical protein [Candidatus Caldarchaeum sp.]MDW8063592.1 hypothetical protein [Candidatus Caldarchaeum sp.]MDW8435377.1 hypothetical protein [Candidatus Caldarchaeum sp.]
MPKMFSKHSALSVILSVGEELTRLAEQKQQQTITVGRGELRQILNRGNRRGKSLLSLALQRFAVSNVFTTSRWVIEVVDRKKPLIIFRKR